MTDTYMQLGHYQDDKLFSFCHGETYAVFQGKMLLPERGERLHVNSVHRIVMLHMVYGETHGGNQRGFWPPVK